MERCISIGPWGSKTEGELWSYKPEGRLIQIDVRHGYAMDALQFQSVKHATGQGESSNRFGGGGGSSAKVCIDAPLEQLESIDMTFGPFDRQTVVTSISFHTNVTKYGPFGRQTGSSVSIPIQGGEIVGFYGRAGRYLNSIGIYVVLKRTESIPSHRVGGALARDIGPWGDNTVGKRWDDGVFSKVRQVRIYPFREVRTYFSSIKPAELRGIQFQYEKADGNLVWSPVHGSDENTGMDPVKFCLNLKLKNWLASKDMLVSSEKDENGCDGVKSITLHTNNGKKYGPYGDENGKHFMSSVTGGKIVGFWGGSGTYLNAIGIHVLYS